MIITLFNRHYVPKIIIPILYIKIDITLYDIAITYYRYIIEISNELVEFEIFVTADIIGGSLVAYQIEYVVDRYPRRQFQTIIL